MKFSIIIPTYNSEQYIDKCLKSIFAINYHGDFEVIVVDGGSVDCTLEIVKRFSLVKLVFSENKSISNSRNIGVTSSCGENLAFIDSDCLVTPSLLSVAEKYLDKYVCCGSFYKADKNHGWIAKTWLQVEKKENGLVKWIAAGTLLVRREFFLEIGGFNEALQTDEDEDFGYRARKVGGQLYNDDRMASIHLGQTDDIKTFFIKEMWRGRTLIKPDGEKDMHKTLTAFDMVIVLYLFVIFIVIGALLYGEFFSISWSLAVFFGGPLVVAVLKTVKLGKIESLFKIYVLYIVFFIARSLALVRYWQFKNLF